MNFSEKYGYTPSKKIQIESMDNVLRNRLINEIANYLKNSNYSDSEIRYVNDKYGYLVCGNNLDTANDFTNLINQSKKIWFLLYDIIDLFFCFENNEAPCYGHPGERKQAFSSRLNKILEEEKAGYRVVNEEIVPLTNPTEIAAIEQASSTGFDAVNKHITKALDLYADRHEPDYENSIKESISAIESICCIITGLSGKQATLGKTIKKLREHDIIIHPAMEDAFIKLYGYTSDEDGIRHGGIDFTNAPSEDAKFMLVSCSAFVDYLIEKYAKIKGEN